MNEWTMPESMDRKSPRPQWWLLYLYFRPRLFFRHFVTVSWPALTVLCAWVFGMAHVVNRIAHEQTKASVGGRASLIPDNWTYLWIMAACAGAVGGAFAYAIGGWWYRLRIRWSGVRESDPKLARRVYIFAAMVAAVPTLILAFAQTIEYPRPSQAVRNPSVWALAILVFPFWSVVTSYCGVREVFGVARIRGFLLFLALPALFYLAAVVALIAMSWNAVGVPPDVQNPLMHQGQATRISYPGNWLLDVNVADHDPDHYLVFIAQQDAWVEFERLYHDGTEDTIIQEFIELARDTQFDTLRSPSFERDRLAKGSFGALMRGQVGGVDYDYRVTVVRVSGSEFIRWSECVRSEHAQHAEPGFALMRQSLRVDPLQAVAPVGDPPDLHNLRTHRGVATEFSYPGNWINKVNEVGASPDWYVLIETQQDAIVEIYRYGSISTISETLRDAMSRYEAVSETSLEIVEELHDVPQLGDAQMVAHGTLNGKRMRFRVTMRRVGEQEFIEVTDICDIDHVHVAEPGIMQILHSLRVRAMAPEGAFATAPPAVFTPQSFENRSLRFTYPGNWALEESDIVDQGAMAVRILPRQDALLQIERYASDETPEQELHHLIEMLDSGSFDMIGEPEIVRNARWEGDVAAQIKATVDGESCTITCIVWPVFPTEYVDIQIIRLNKDANIIAPGVDQVLLSLEVLPPMEAVSESN